MKRLSFEINDATYQKLQELCAYYDTDKKTLLSSAIDDAYKEMTRYSESEIENRSSDRLEAIEAATKSG